MVTVGYEQARGLRQRYETPEGCQVTVTKTYPVPIAELFLAWVDSSVRAQWLPGASLTIRRVAPHKSIAATWSDGQTSLDVRFSSRGESKSQVAVEHPDTSGPSAEEVPRIRAYWKDALERLGALLA